MWGIRRWGSWGIGEVGKRADKSAAELSWMEPWWFYQRRLGKDWSTTPFSKLGYWVRTYGAVAAMIAAFFVAVTVISGSQAQALAVLPWWRVVVIGLVLPVVPAVLASMHVLMPRLLHFRDYGVMSLQGQATVHLKYGDADSVKIVEHGPGQIELIICYKNNKGKDRTMTMGVRERVDLDQLAVAIGRLKQTAASGEASDRPPLARERCTVTHDPFAF